MGLEERFVYSKESARGLDKVNWAKSIARERFLSGVGERNSTFFEKCILDEEGKPILKKRTWENFLGQLRLEQEIHHEMRSFLYFKK